MRRLLGLRIPGAGREMGSAMNGLMNASSPAEAEPYLARIAQLRGRPLDEIRAEYQRFQEIRAQRDAAVAGGAEPIPDLSDWHASFMGSNTQLRYGQVVGDAFGVDPVFGAMLNPTGGIVGPGNKGLPGDDTPLGYHGVVHDAAGYLYNYHGAGPGYNYLGVEPFPTSNPLTGQVSGVAYWTGVVRGAEIMAIGDTLMSGFGAAVDAGSWLFSKAGGIF
jgi:hypothetical protein